MEPLFSGKCSKCRFKYRDMNFALGGRNSKQVSRRGEGGGAKKKKQTQRNIFFFFSPPTPPPPPGTDNIYHSRLSDSLANAKEESYSYLNGFNHTVDYLQQLQNQRIALESNIIHIEGDRPVLQFNRPGQYLANSPVATNSQFNPIQSNPSIN